MRDAQQALDVGAQSGDVEPVQFSEWLRMSHIEFLLVREGFQGTGAIVTSLSEDAGNLALHKNADSRTAIMLGLVPFASVHDAGHHCIFAFSNYQGINVSIAFWQRLFSSLPDDEDCLLRHKVEALIRSWAISRWTSGALASRSKASGPATMATADGTWWPTRRATSTR